MKKKLSVLLLLVCFAFLGFGSISAFAATDSITIVFTNPAEDCSTGMMFSWHSNGQSSRFYYALSDESFSVDKSVLVNGKKDDTWGTYSYKYEMKNLEPDTQYKYYITSGTAKTETYTFRTAAIAKEFDFLWITDIHTYPTAAERITFANNLLTKMDTDCGGANLILSTGDEVAYGGDYDAYRTLTDLKKNSSLQKMTWACVPGNHTYYEKGASSLKTNAFYESATNHPKNGFNDKNSSFWFLYNGVLFVGIDSLSIQNSTVTLSDAQDWFRTVVSKNVGKYQYLVVYQHYPWLNALTGSKDTGYTSNYKKWYQIFDEYGVDLALAGDYHTYYRSNSLYENQVSEDESKGTVYMGGRQVGGRAAGGSYYIKDRQNPEVYACRLDNEEATTSGACYFTVSASGIKMKMYDNKTLKVLDECEIKAKRGITWESKKVEVENSFFLNETDGKPCINYDSSNKDYIKKIEVYSNQQLITSIKPCDDASQNIILEGLEKNRSYSFDIRVTYVDNTVKAVRLNGTTCGYFGNITGFRVTGDGKNLGASFSYDLKNNIVTKFSITQGGREIDAFDVTSQKGNYSKSFENAVLDANYGLLLKALDKDGNIVYEKLYQYQQYGDLSFDGKIDELDLDKIFDLVNANKTLENHQLELMDMNKDGVCDVGDAILIYQTIINGKALEEHLFKVVILDNDGNVLSKQMVKEMDDVTLPDAKAIDGYTFKYYTASGEDITCDCIIKAVYDRN